MRAIRRMIAAFIYAALGFIIIILVLRMFIDFFELGKHISFFIEFTNILLDPFWGLITPISIFGIKVNLTGVFAIFSYLLLATLIEQLLTSLFFWDPRIIFIEIIMWWFKLIEYVFSYRLLLVLFAGSQDNWLREFTYSLTGWLINPLNSVIPRINFLNGHIEISTIIIIILIFIIDVFVEFFLVNFLLVRRPRR